MSTTVENKDLIDRKAASRLLKVSTRTLDRYRQGGRLSTRIIDNKILLSKSEVLDFIHSQSRQEKNAKMSSDRYVDTPAQVDSTDDVQFVETRQVEPPVTSHDRDHDTDLIDMYKKMYEELSLELRKRQDELEGAHYRIGQLEGQLRYAIPLPEHKSEILKLTESTQLLEQDVMEKQVRLKKIREAFYYEKLNKRIYFTLVIGLLLLQPLWIYLAD